MSTATLPLTAHEFAEQDHRGKELVDGEIVELPMSIPSSLTASEIFGRIWHYCQQHRIGRAFGADTGIRCFPDDPERVRKPDACFVRQEKLTPTALTAAFLPVVPDLVVEVVSPNDLATEVDRKVAEYLDAGVQLVWVINPETRTGRVHRADGTISALRDSDDLDGEQVLPGFRCRLSDVLP